MADLHEKLGLFMTRILGRGALSGLVRLSGGANMESWSFDWSGPAGSAGYVLRRAPSADYMAGRPYGHADEAALVMAAHAAGVKAPEVVGVLSDADGMGTGYVMRRIVAEVSPAKILADPPPSLLADLGRELARIHAIPRAAIPARSPPPSYATGSAPRPSIRRAACPAAAPPPAPGPATANSGPAASECGTRTAASPPAAPC